LLQPGFERACWFRLFAFIIGENAIDAGGPYRESWSGFAQELMSPALPLLSRSPNSVHQVGSNRETWVLNPDATSPDHLQMFAFLGKLIGMAVRTRNYLELNLAPIVWKAIVEETVTLADVKAIDEVACNMLESLKDHDHDDDYFAAVELTFVSYSLAGHEVELHPSGASEIVTNSNKAQYCRELEAYLTGELRVVAQAVRAGLSTILPPGILRLITGAELEKMACGNPVIDVGLLRDNTVYDGYSPSDNTIGYFWECISEFSEREKVQFLRFSWGRSRLPTSRYVYTQTASCTLI
jgi:E3 ubiquitin-protein ligase HERC2